MKALADLSVFNEEQVKNHLACQYKTESFYEDFENIGNPDPVIVNQLKDLEILLAYESVGDYGCDSSSFFLFKNKLDGKISELHGSHCSCYGFEGQFTPEETNIEALKLRASNGFYFTGGYDDNEDENKKQVYDFIIQNL